MITAELADGRKLEFPDGTDPAVIQATVKRVLGSQPQLDQAPTTSERIAANPITRFAVGTARPVLGAAQLLSKVNPLTGAVNLGPDLVKPISETLTSYDEMARRGGAEGLDVAGIAGSVMNPLGLAAGKVLPAATSLAGRVGQGAAIGTTYGVTNPVQNPENFVEEKAAQAATGAAIGGALPIGVAAIKYLGGTARDIAELYMPNGAMRIFTRYQNRIIGESKEAKDKIIAALRNAEEYVKGSKPTAAEAVSSVPEASPMLAYQQIVAATPGGPSGQFGQRTLDQEAARRAALQTIGQGKPALTAAEAARDEAAKKAYGAVANIKVTPDDTFAQLASRPSMARAISRAKELSEEAGEQFVAGNSYPVRSLHYVKMALDDMIKNPERFSIGASEARAIGKTKDVFLGWLENKVPGYGTARTQYALDSRVIDRMKIGQALEGKLVSATEKETPGSFALATRNELSTIKKATGQPRYQELEQILTPEEVKTVQSVLADVTRKSRSFNQPQRTNLAGGGVNVAEEVRPHGPVLWSRPVSIVNWLLGSKSAEVEKIVDKIATEKYLNPEKLADILEKLPSQQKNKLLQILQQQGAPMATGLPVQATIQGNQ